MSKVVPRAGAPIAEMIDDATRQQLEAFRDQLADEARAKALERPRDDLGRYAQVPSDQLVRDNKTLQRMRDVTAAVGDRTVGWLLDKAQVPSVTQLTKRYATQASRAPLLGMLAGKSLGPTEAAVLGTTPRLGTGGALVVYQPKLPATVARAPAPEVQAPLQIEYKRADGANEATGSGRAGSAGRAERTGRANRANQAKPTWWDSLKAFGKSVVDTAKSAWTQLKTHPLVASVMSFFVGKGYGPAHASMHGANPPREPARGAPLGLVALEAPTAETPDVQTPKAKLQTPRLVPPLAPPKLEAPAPRNTPAVISTPAPPAVIAAPAPPAVIAAPAPLVDPSVDLDGAIENMRRLWPAGVESAPAAFRAQAQSLQALKAEGLEALGEAPAPGAVSKYLDQCDAMHGKPGHSRNVARLAEGLFRDPQISALLHTAPGFSARTADQVRATAPYLGLGDVQTPVELLAGRRPLVGGEVRAHLVPRGARAAALFAQLELGSPKTGALLESAREVDPERPLGSQLVRLLDDTAALAAKPSCRKGSKVDADALTARLEDNAANGAYHPELVGLIGDAARRGLVDAALSEARPEDLYQR